MVFSSCLALLSAHGKARALCCVTRLLWGRHASKHHRARAEQVQGCLHLSGEMYFFSTAQELRIRSFSSVNTAYLGARSVWENIVQIWSEEFFQVYKLLNVYKVLNGSQ